MLLNDLTHDELQALKELGVSHDKLHRATIRAQRITQNAGPDGAKGYVPLTSEYEATRYLGPHTLRRIKAAEGK